MSKMAPMKNKNEYFKAKAAVAHSFFPRRRLYFLAAPRTELPDAAAYLLAAVLAMARFCLAIK
jgi:hypothetical protein